MGARTIAVLVTIAFSVIGVLGDYFLKLASAREQSLRTSWFYLGFALYASTAFGWVFVMKHLKLATISVLYSVSLVLLLTGIGVVLFRESLNYFVVIGIVFAVISLVLIDALRVAAFDKVSQTFSSSVQVHMTKAYLAMWAILLVAFSARCGEN
jgi:drug/metabolite transporter (DMT)-like permease